MSRIGAKRIPRLVGAYGTKKTTFRETKNGFPNKTGHSQLRGGIRRDDGRRMRPNMRRSIRLDEKLVHQKQVLENTGQGDVDVLGGRWGQRAPAIPVAERGNKPREVSIFFFLSRFRST